jgi:hypothetical protein
MSFSAEYGEDSKYKKECPELMRLRAKLGQKRNKTDSISKPTSTLTALPFFWVFGDVCGFFLSYEKTVESPP